MVGTKEWVVQKCAYEIESTFQKGATYEQLAKMALTLKLLLKWGTYFNDLQNN